ncbi:HD domain-containing protein, partial [bacterium]|nr:HD domain-containing protein [bacterium]
LCIGHIAPGGYMFILINKICRTLKPNDMRRQFVVAMVLVAILPLIFLSVGLYYYNAMPLLNSFINFNRNMLDRQLILEQISKTRDLADELADYFHQIETQSVLLTSVSDNDAFPLIYRKAIISDYLKRFPRILWMHTDHGFQVGISDSVMQDILDRTVSGKIPVYSIGDSGLKISSPIQIPTYSQESLLVMSIPSIFDNSTRVTLLMELPSVETLKEDASLEDSLIVVDDRGKLILKSGDIVAMLGDDMTSLPVVNAFVNKGITDEASVYKLEDGRAIRGILSRVEMVNWGLITQKQPSNSTGVMLEMESSAADLIHRLALASILGVLSVGLLAGVIGALVAIRFTKPLHLILQGIEIVKKGNYSYRFKNVGPVDIRELAKTLNSLTGSIQQSTEDLREHGDQMRNMFIGSVSALVAAIDAKDPYTRGHSRRVQIISMILGRRMGLNQTELSELEISALMHDIGKLGIDEALLRKPGLLTAEERKTLEHHPVLGAEIMRHIPMFMNMLPGMLHHHERWDGSGYPDGLIGEAIPLYGRIITVADTFDAMTSSRPYQETVTHQEACELITQWSGTRYDPLVVDALVVDFDEICSVSNSVNLIAENATICGV